MHVQIDYNAKCSLSGLNFQYFSRDEVHKLSVKDINKAQALDRLLNPIQGGLYDLALGPLDKNDVCLTCHLDYFQCPGHFGHIDLALPVYNPVFFKELVKLLRASCYSCHYLLTNRLEKDYFLAKMTVIDHGLVEHLPQVADLYAKILRNNAESPNFAKLSFKHDFDDLVRFIVSKANENNHLSAAEKRSSSNTKHVVKAKQEALKEFLDVKLKVGRKACVNCGLPQRELRAEHNAKIFYSKLSSRLFKRNQQAKLVTFNEAALNAGGLSQDADRLSEDIGKMEMADDENDEFVSEDKTEAADDEDQLEALSSQTYLTPVKCRKHLYTLIENEREIVELMLGKTEQTSEAANQADLFFFDTLAVPPSKFRPVSQFKEQKFENPQTSQLSKIIAQNLILRDILVEIIGLANEANGGSDSVVSLFENCLEFCFKMIHEQNWIGL
jgi:DNA-directed RNA polymerase I subunit RPA1